MWICVKDRSGKYMINVSDFEQISCRKFESEDYYSLVFMIVMKMFHQLMIMLKNSYVWKSRNKITGINSQFFNF